MKFDVKDINLAEQGKLKIEWAKTNMPVVSLIEKRFEKEKPLNGINISGCLHVTAETANLAIALKNGGANVSLCASNPLSTQDDVAASLVKNYEIPVFAIKGEDKKTYYEHLNACLDNKPNITMDDGGDLVNEIYSRRKELIENVWAGTEETTTGVIRFKAMEKDKVLPYPIIAVNDSDTKHLFDNRYGTGQSTLDGILRATNQLIAGKNFVVAGYGWCSRGIAMRAKGFGANIIVTEVDAVKALEAVMDGFRVMPMLEAAKTADIIVTATGDINVIDKQHFEAMKNNCIIANSGHFNVEINIPELEKMSSGKRTIRPFTNEYTLKNGKKVFLLADGRLVNLAAAEGHPSVVMDLSFANQALGAEFIKNNRGKLEKKVHVLSREIDYGIAELKLEAMNVKIDRLTKEQEKYLNSYDSGT